jgi:GNAT superfamily N-acetyltransferase
VTHIEDRTAPACDPRTMDEETPISRHHPATLFSRVSPHDGLRVGLRLARPTDQARVRAFLERLSPETRRRRFGTPLPQVSETLVRHFTLPDPRRRLIVLATAPGDGGEQVAGIADAVFEGGDTGEIAFVVADELQGRGIGRLLAEAAGGLAARRGARRLKADISGGRAAALALMRRLGPTVTLLEEGSMVVFTTLPAAPEERSRERGRWQAPTGRPARARQ